MGPQVSEQASYTPRPTRPTLRSRALGRTFPLAPLQEGMLFHSVAAPRPGVDFQQFTCTMAPGFDVEAFRHAWQGVIDRHAILRTSFHWEDLPEPVQCVHERVAMPVELLDFSEVPDAELPARIRRTMLADRLRGFDVTRAPCMRLLLAQLAGGRWLVLWSFHHLLLDGRSFFTVLTDLFESYEAIVDGREPVLEEHRPFGDYLEWLRARDRDGARAFFRDVLAGASPTPLGVTRTRLRELSTDESPSGRYETRLSRETSDRLREVARANDVTVNTLVHAAWSIVLHRYAGASDVVFGATRAGRHGTVPGAESMVGMTINTLPVRARLSREEPARALAHRLRELWVAMRPHEHTPLIEVMEAAGQRADTPLFDSIIVAENYDWKTALRERVGDYLEPGFEITEWTNYAITVVADLGPELILAVEYDRRRFDDEVPERVLGHLRLVMERFADGLEQPIGSISLLSDDERELVLRTFNATSAPYDTDACVHHLFDRHAVASPNAPAVGEGARTLTYAELAACSNRLAHELRRLGVGPDVPVGICADRGLELAVGLLAILKAGGAYVPLDPEYPADRLRYMLAESDAKVVLVQARLADQLPDARFERVLLDGRAGAGAADDDPGPPESGVRPHHRACVFYTSGSTGRPKGVALRHGGIVNHSTHMIRALGLGPDDRIPQSASTSFDLAVLELFGTWAAGATVVMRPHGVLASSRLGPWLEAEGITVFHMPTALWHQWAHDLADQDACLPAKLRLVLVGGEKASTAAVNAWRRLGRGRCRWVNIYGPTECTVNATVYEPDFSTGRDIEGEIPIGKPISNVKIYLVDDALEPVPVGVPGELYIGGAGVSGGYLRAPELTTHKFVPDPFIGDEGARMYRTGDLARWSADGHIEFIGRRDHQVKIRGFRVELGEVETELEKHPALREVVVTALAEGDTRRLVAYVVPIERAVPDPEELRRFLKQTLPEYMIPSAFVCLDELPHSPNGKVDRSKLPSPDVSPAIGDTTYVAPRNAVEETLVTVFERVLERERVGIHDSFFDLGGHSLLALRILDEVGRSGLSLTVEQLFEHPTVAELAAVASWDGARDGNRSPLVALRRGGKRVPFYFAHTTPGDVLGYTDLVRELGADQPVYGFQSLGLYDPKQAHRTMEEMAACYVEVMRSLQPEGPYQLVGWCYGGVVVFEMAQQLLRAGQTVGFVGLIDAHAPRPGLTHYGWYLDRLRAIAGLDPKRFGAYASRKLDGWFGSRQKRNARALEVQVSRGPLANREAVSSVNLRAVRAYQPSFYPGRVTLFRRTEPAPGIAEDPWLGWRHLVGQLDVVPIATATHQSILRMPHVRALARSIRERAR